jgi:hypothetical protein
MCVDCGLASLRIAQADPGRRTPPRGRSVTDVKCPRRGCVTPYFSKRIGFYKFKQLNKYLFVAIHDVAYFSLDGEVFLDFILRVEVAKFEFELNSN